jgi:KaiC/GvpD/RAD55 family RecA-like ATPase
LTRTIFVAETLPGSGKTEKFISMLPSILKAGKRVVYSLPTNKLTSELKARLKESGIDARCINVESTNSVINDVEQALAERGSDVLVITHEALQRVEGILLRGWMLVVDEVPNIWNCKNPNFNNHSYQKAVAPFVSIDDAGTATIAGDCRNELEALVREGASQSAYQERALEVFDGLLDRRSVVKVDALDNKMKRLVRIIAYKDYLSRFAQADEVHVLANNVSRTLLGYMSKRRDGRSKPLPSPRSLVDTDARY